MEFQWWSFNSNAKQLYQYTEKCAVYCLRSRELVGRWRHNFAYRGRMIQCSSQHSGRLLGLICLFSLLINFGPPCLPRRELSGKWHHTKLPNGNSHGANSCFSHIAVADGKPELFVYRGRITWWENEKFTSYIYLFSIFVGPPCFNMGHRYCIYILFYCQLLSLHCVT